MARRRWSELDDRTRRLVIVAAAAEGALKVAALIDLWRRPSNQVRGSKVRWAAAVVLINSAGLVPVGYFWQGRRNGPRA